MSKKLVGKLAVITGGSDGLGLAIAKAYAAEGSTIILIAREQRKLDRAAEQIRAFDVDVQTYSADLSRTKEREDLVDTLAFINTNRKIDVLVNNAGASVFTPLGQITMQEFEKQVSLNVAAPLFLTQSLLPLMRRPNASVINVSSYFANKLLWNRPSSVYSLTKGALNSLTKAMAFELANDGIRVNAIAPGTVDTALRRSTINSLPPEQQEKIAESIPRLYPTGRIGRAEDINGMAVYLASDESAWTTGAILNVDGGLSLT